MALSNLWKDKVNNLNKILVVDDEPKIVDVVRSYLTKCGYKVVVAYNGKNALSIFERMNPELVILDLMLPDLTGEEVCTKLRQKSRVPIIMLTAKIAEEDVLAGLSVGADDYMTKPFSPKELMARVDAILRRGTREMMPLSSFLSYNDGELVIDCKKHEIRIFGEVLSITPQEYRILMAMVKYPTKAFTREELISLIFDNEFEGIDRIIDSHIKNLRRKIEKTPRNPKYILTVYGVGYKFGGEIN